MSLSRGSTEIGNSSILAVVLIDAEIKKMDCVGNIAVNEGLKTHESRIDVKPKRMLGRNGRRYFGPVIPIFANIFVFVLPKSMTNVMHGKIVRKHR